MQSKLATWSAADPHRRIDRLSRLIAQRDWLLVAAEKTLASPGAKTAGVDGMDRQLMEPVLNQQLVAGPTLPWSQSTTGSRGLERQYPTPTPNRSAGRAAMETWGGVLPVR